MISTTRSFSSVLVRSTQGDASSARDDSYGGILAKIRMPRLPIPKELNMSNKLRTHREVGCVAR